MQHKKIQGIKPMGLSAPWDDYKTTIINKHENVVSEVPCGETTRDPYAGTETGDAQVGG